MERLFSAKKYDFIVLNNTLYVIRTQGSETNIEALEIGSFNKIDELIIDFQIRGKNYFLIDENCIYVIDNNANLLCIDKISGKIIKSVELKSICVCTPVQTKDKIFILSILPTRVKSLKFSTYFIIEFNKNTFEIRKHSSYNGTPVRDILLRNDSIIFADNEQVRCLSLDFNEKWNSSLKLKANSIYLSSEYLLLSAQNGAIQCFSASNGKNRFNIQLPESFCRAGIKDNTLLWNNKDTIYKIDIEKVTNRDGNWQEKLKTTLPNISSLTYGEKLVVGNLSGEISAEDDYQKVCSDAIINIGYIDRLLLCESPTEVHFFNL